MRPIDADALLAAYDAQREGPPGKARKLIENAPTVGGWISVTDRLPEDGVTVLAVKELKSGRRDMTLAYCIREYDHYDPVSMTHTRQPYWVCGGNNHIVYWMPLPKISED